MKPALSPHTTGVLPSFSTSTVTESTAAGSVTTVRTTSTSCWTGAGLKKCTPSTRRGFAVATEISVTESEEVLVASTVSWRVMLSSWSKIERLRSRSSQTASTTRSASATAAMSVPTLIRFSNAARSSSVNLPSVTARAVECSRRSCARSAAAWSFSTPITVMPVRASTSAIPDPMVPRPMTPAVANSAGTANSSTPARPRSAARRGAHVTARYSASSSAAYGCDRASRALVARCSVDYVGRLTAHLPLATRLLLIKADGSVLVHSDGGSYKPLNWMSPPCTLKESAGSMVVINKAGEELRITLEEVLSDSSFELGVDPGLQKDGVEAHLQILLAENAEVFGAGWRARAPRVPDLDRPGRPVVQGRRRRLGRGGDQASR